MKAFLQETQRQANRKKCKKKHAVVDDIDLGREARSERKKRKPQGL